MTTTSKKISKKVSRKVSKKTSKKSTPESIPSLPAEVQPPIIEMTMEQALETMGGVEQHILRIEKRFSEFLRTSPRAFKS